MNGHHWIEGSVLLLACTGCGRRFPVLALAGENDMVTAGSVPLTSRKDGTIRVVHREELSEAIVGGDWCEVRISRVMPAEVLPGETFQRFLARKSGPTLVYGCIHCGADCTVIEEVELLQWTESHEMELSEGIRLKQREQ